MDEWDFSELLDGWRIACFGLAGVIVFFFGEEIYQAVGLLFWGFDFSVYRVVRTFLENVVGESDYTNHPLRSLLMFPVVVVVCLLALAVMIPAAIVFWIVQWLVTSSGSVHSVTLFIFDGVLVFLIGSFLYGVIFPLLWMALGPLLAATFGDVAYERARARVLGDRPRFVRPFYLIVAVLCLGIGILRLAAPVAEQGREAFQELAERTYYPPTPAPPAWPKAFSVQPKQTVYTGIRLADKSEELYVWASAHVFLSIGSERVLIRRNVDQRETGYFSLAQTGEIVLQGADSPATVRIGQPELRVRRWLSRGEVRRIDKWADEGGMLWYCGGEGLQFRTVRKGRAGSWEPLPSRSPCEAGYGYIGHSLPEGHTLLSSGFVEVKADRVTWFNFLQFDAAERWFDVPAGRLVDTGFAVRSGDRLRIAAVGDPIYLVTSKGEESLIPAGHYREQVAGKPGSVRVRGGVVGSRAKVLVIARGPGWK